MVEAHLLLLGHDLHGQCCILMLLPLFARVHSLLLLVAPLAVLLMLLLLRHPSLLLLLLVVLVVE